MAIRTSERLSLSARKKPSVEAQSRQLLQNLEKQKELAVNLRAQQTAARFAKLPKVDLGAQIEELKKREGGYTAPEQEAMWSQMAARANAQQQAAQRALAARQAQMGIRGGAGSAQLARAQQQFAAQRAMGAQELGIKNIDEVSRRFAARQELERQQQLANVSLAVEQLRAEEAARAGAEERQLYRDVYSKKK